MIAGGRSLSDKLTIDVKFIVIIRGNADNGFSNLKNSPILPEQNMFVPDRILNFFFGSANLSVKHLIRLQIRKF